MRTLLIALILLILEVPSSAKDNNPFSGAISMQISMTRDHKAVKRRYHRVKRNF